MTGSSILPVSVYKGKLYFLFGKENQMEDSAHGFSDFGGGVDAGENVYETALREGSEELTGFLGNKHQLKKFIKKNGGVFKLEHNSDPSGDPNKSYHVHIFAMNYDVNLPIYYNLNHSFLWSLMDKHTLNKSKLFEKIEIKWVCEDDLTKNMGMYRKFYCDIVRKIVENIGNIRKFVCKRKMCGNTTASATTSASASLQNRKTKKTGFSFFHGG